MYSLLFANVVMLATGVIAKTTTQLFNFTGTTSIENSILRPNGHLLFTTIVENNLYSLDLFAPHPQAELIATFPDVTATNGIAAIGRDKYAMLGGVRGANYHYTNESLFTIDFTSDTAIATVATLPDAVMLNGLAALPANPHIVLAADSRLGALFRIDTDTGDVSIALQDELLVAPSNASTPIGVNGVKIARGHVYFTVTAPGLFGRVPITEDGEVVGDVEILAYNESGYNWDDFAIDIDGDGSAYVCQGDNSIVRITPDGRQETVVGGPESLAMIGPTSVSIRPHAKGEKKVMYVTTRGGTVNGVVYSGQVVEVR